VIVSVEFEECELVTGGRLISAAGHLKTERFIKVDGGIKVADTNASVKKFDHGY
jgi:hypothetical protein